VLLIKADREFGSQITQYLLTIASVQYWSKRVKYYWDIGHQLPRYCITCMGFTVCWKSGKCKVLLFITWLMDIAIVTDRAVLYSVIKERNVQPYIKHNFIW